MLARLVSAKRPRMLIASRERFTGLQKSTNEPNSSFPAHWSGFLQEKSQNQRHDDAVKQRFETGLIVRQCKVTVAFRDLDEPRSECRDHPISENSAFNASFAERV